MPDDISAKSNSPVSGPLAGVRVLEFVGIGPGPHAAMLLADMGAEVVRIEREGAGDAMNPVVERARHRIGVDIRTDEGRALCRAAAQNADVVIEGYRPGVMERAGLGPDVLCQLNPRLIYARMTGWGQDGPLAKAAGHDINYIAVAGALDGIGQPGQPAVPPQNLVGDFGGGSLYCALGVVSALFERTVSGRGQVVDAAIVDGVTSLMSFFSGMGADARLVAERGRSLLGGTAPYYRCYTCADGVDISLGALEPQFYAEFVERVGGGADLTDGRDDPRNWPRIAGALTALFAGKPSAHWVDLLEGTDACVAAVVPIAAAHEHPHLQARGSYVERGGIRHTAPAPRFSRTPGTIRDSAMDGAQVIARWAEERPR